MLITIKQLQGGETSIEVIPSTKILDIKLHVAAKLRIPLEEQTLLLLGRALTDHQTVESYPSIKDGTKLNLVVKKPEGLLETATKYFKTTGDSDIDAKNKAIKLVKQIDENIMKLSWDDCERLCIDLMNEECGLNDMEEDDELDSEDTFGL